MDDPIELPDGRLVCAKHCQVVCFRCCVDYSFMDDVLEKNNDSGDSDELPELIDPRAGAATEKHGDSEESDKIIKVFKNIDIGEHPRKGTGRVFPTKFVPPSKDVTPEALFSGRKQHIMVFRYTLPNDKGTGLIYTDGACVDNGKENPKAGWAFWHGETESHNKLFCEGRLEAKGPFGDVGAQTSNRAELRAVIAALRFRYWPGEFFDRLVFATDSEYVVEGATNWAIKWVAEGWTRRASPGSRKRTEVKNRDLWEALLGEVERYAKADMTIEFWRIPREWNTVADAAAKAAAVAEENAPDEFEDIKGMNC